MAQARGPATSASRSSRASSAAWPTPVSMRCAWRRRCTGSIVRRSSPNARACSSRAACWWRGVTRTSNCRRHWPRPMRRCRTHIRGLLAAGARPGRSRLRRFRVALCRARGAGIRAGRALVVAALAGLLRQLFGQQALSGSDRPRPGDAARPGPGRGVGRPSVDTQAVHWPLFVHARRKEWPDVHRIDRRRRHAGGPRGSAAATRACASPSAACRSDGTCSWAKASPSTACA